MIREHAGPPPGRRAGRWHWTVRLRSWWRDDRVRTIGATAHVRRDLLMRSDLVSAVSRDVVHRVIREAERGRWRVLGRVELEHAEDYATNRVAIRASARVAGYPSRRWRVLFDPFAVIFANLAHVVGLVLTWLLAPVRMTRGFALLVGLLLVVMAVSSVVRAASP